MQEMGKKLRLLHGMANNLSVVQSEIEYLATCVSPEGKASLEAMRVAARRLLKQFRELRDHLTPPPAPPTS